MIVVDMRIKDHKSLSFHDDLNVLKLFRYDQHLNIPYLLKGKFPYPRHCLEKQTDYLHC